MAYKGGKRSSSITRSSSSDNDSILSRKGGAGYVAKRLLKSTGRVAWVAGTTFFILVGPLIIRTHREQQLNELELQQASLHRRPSEVK